MLKLFRLLILFLSLFSSLAFADRRRLHSFTPEPLPCETTELIMRVKGAAYDGINMKLKATEFQIGPHLFYASNNELCLKQNGGPGNCNLHAKRLPLSFGGKVVASVDKGEGRVVVINQFKAPMSPAEFDFRSRSGKLPHSWDISRHRVEISFMKMPSLTGLEKNSAVVSVGAGNDDISEIVLVEWSPKIPPKPQIVDLTKAMNLAQMNCDYAHREYTLPPGRRK